MAARVRFEDKPDRNGYWASVDGRWKAKERRVRGEPPAVTLTDTTRRTVFAETGASWIRLADWAAVRAMIAAH
ncbi:hypothetical protein [Actinomycetospora termitidis]|uniref:Uncharacterized protein n=1 Tax=Actinomycetospora termitidis TaxID=3053470 RepID=A0ABT7MJQ1_9PSEU|nr:hypothetical protein [Actinomycetospora sp. Odt1-22]MDL5160439.1 hypothetical protein [Actinomycetospora sp. Odt1-22]